MSFLTHDVQHKSALAASLPSVSDFIAAGGEIERVEDEPRVEFTMARHCDMVLPGSADLRVAS